MSEAGTETTVPNITLDDITSYYSNYITNKGMKVVIVGDLKEAEILPKLAFLDKLPNKKLSYLRVAGSPLPNNQSTDLFDRHS